MVDGEGRPLPPGMALAVPPGGRTRLHVCWTPPPGAAGAVREFLYLRWGGKHQLTVGLSGTVTTPTAAATTAAPPSGKAPRRDALHPELLRQGTTGEDVGRKNPVLCPKHAAAGVSAARNGGLAAAGAARRLALGTAPRSEADDCSSRAVHERDAPRAAAAAPQLPAADAMVARQATASGNARGAGPGKLAGGCGDVNAENERPPSSSTSAGSKPGTRAERAFAGPSGGLPLALWTGPHDPGSHAANASPNSSAASSATVVEGAGMEAGNPRRSRVQDPPAETAHRRASRTTGAVTPRVLHRNACPPGTPGRSSVASGALAAPRSIGASLRLGRRRSGTAAAAAGTETSVSVRKSFSFAQKGLWLEKQEKALTMWLNSVLAPGGCGASVGADAADPGDTLAAGRLAAQLKGQLCRYAPVYPLRAVPDVLSDHRPLPR